MKIKFLKEYSLEFLKENINSNISHYSDKDNSWISEVLEGEEVFLDFKEEIDDFELDMSEKDPAKTDLENIKRVYLGMKNLTQSQAVDERLWTGLAHDKFWSYMQYRWKIDIENNNERDKIYTRYFYKYGKRRSVVFHGIARLWWVGRLTYDESLENPFEITEYMVNDLSTKNLYLISSTFTCNDDIRMGMFKSILHFERKGIRIGRGRFNKLMKKLNLIGGVYLLDFFTEDEIKYKCINYLNEIINDEDKEKIEKNNLKKETKLNNKKDKIIDNLNKNKDKLSGKQIQVFEYIINNLENISEFSNAKKLGEKLGVSPNIINIVLLRCNLGSYSKFLGDLKKYS